MDRSGGRLRRRSLGAAFTFAVAAVGGVAGNRLSDRVTPALAVFAGLLVVGMLLTYWVDRGARVAELPVGDGDSGETGNSLATDLRGAQGVQIGDKNWQENYFGRDRDS